MKNREEIIRRIKDELARKPKPYTDEWYAEIKERFDNMKPFVCADNIPDIPIFKDYGKYKDIIVDNLVRCGAIPKNKLIVGKTYIGVCRNASEAEWNGEEFIYKRYKFGITHDDTIKHFEDEMYYDVFIPIKEKKDNIEHG